MAIEKVISILGCGYVGLPVARELLTHRWRVRGSTTRKDKLGVLVSYGVEPYLIRLTPELSGEGLTDFFDSDVVLLNFPPGRRRDDVGTFLTRAVDSLVLQMRKARVRRVVFASSTSVYASGIVAEDDAGRRQPLSPSGRALLAAERTLQQERSFSTTILRFAGLYGHSRKPGRFLKEGPLRGGQRSVNLVHLDDAVAVTARTIVQGIEGEVFNVCADEHPSRADFYTRAAGWLDRPPPVFIDEDNAPDKVVLNDKVRARLDYEFIHPDPLRRAP